eukprot:CAMPEP_0198280648 /NCGR_PEP_ID=MMETSP1449-20131203/702_1 /TAXON_ID=420275 /ORGANISM="Attheya septentrionalis, Strain CCMP2084" /LENGTH=58 /DNA_ID=CAMNT_0043976071 /DNA_START=486 /DNA_END=662 /DNA_ORIENTATION=+
MTMNNTQPDADALFYGATPQLGFGSIEEPYYVYEGFHTLGDSTTPPSNEIEDNIDQFL